MNAFTHPVTRWMAGLCFVALLGMQVAKADPEFDPPGRVARLNLAEGAVSVQPQGSKTWSDEVANRPLTSGDRIWADRQARAELHVGSTAIRLGSETGLAFETIDDRAVRLQLNAGSLQVRVRALGPDDTFEIATPFARVAVLTPGSYRLDVSPRGDELRVAVQQGEVAVTDNADAVTVAAGRQTRFHGAVAAAEPERLDGSDGLDQWAAERDRREDRSLTPRYVSREVIGYEDLDDYGTWDVVADYGPVWRPNVAFGWSPYRHGHWVWITPWGWTWIDDAPWGFAPFHYGRWVHLHGNWCWTPGPRVAMPYYAPALVGWVGGFSVGIGIGAPPVAWFPLGWNEVYVPSYRSSRNYVENINVTNIHVTNVVVNQYYDRARSDRNDHARENPREFRNYAVNGAVVATTRSAFAAGQPVNAHPADLPRVDRPRIDHLAPDVAPVPGNVGRPAAVTPRQDIFTRPVMGTGPAPTGRMDGNRPEAPRIPDYRPPLRTPTAPANPNPQMRTEPPRNEWRPGAVPEARPSAPDYRPPTVPQTPPARSEWRPEPTPAPAPRSEWRPPAGPDTRPAVPDYRPPVTAPSPPVRNEWRPEPTPAPAPVPERRYEAPRVPDYRPAPAESAPPPERRYEAPRMPDYHPAPTPMPDYRPAPTPSAPPAMREYHPSAPPPVTAPAARQPSAPQPKDDRRDRPH